MGCVTLEFMIWLLYGYGEVKSFKRTLSGPFSEPSGFYDLMADHIVPGSSLAAQIHHTVQARFEEISQHPECTEHTALGHLLEVVRTKLLVVKLPSPDRLTVTSRVNTNKDTSFNTPRQHERVRTDAKGFVEALDNILEHQNAANETFWVTGQPRQNLPNPARGGSIQLSVDRVRRLPDVVDGGLLSPPPMLRVTDVDAPDQDRVVSL